MIFPFAILLITSLSILVSPAVVNKRASTVAAVLNDITELTADVADLNTAINAIPITGANFASVATAGVNGLNVVVTLSQLTTDVKNLGTTVDLTDAANILAQMTTLQGQVISIITVFVARKNTVEGALAGAGFFALNNFKILIDAMATAMINAAPPQISRVTTLALKAGVDNALTAALAAFPSCSSLISIGLNL